MLILISSVYHTKEDTLGIGFENKLCWNIPDDLKFFRKQTMNNIIVMGRKTFDSIGKALPDRINIVLSSTLNQDDYPDIVVVKNLTQLDILLGAHFDRKIYIIGGESLYNHFIDRCSFLAVTHIEKTGKPDMLFDSYHPMIDNTFKLTDWSSAKYHDGIVYRYLVYSNCLVKINKTDDVYLDLMNKILKEGTDRIDRTLVGTRSLFAQHITFDLKDSCPLLTTKRVAWKTCILELLWFLKGKTDTNILKNQGVKIWSGNTTREFLDSRGLNDYPEGELGPGYPWQIRRSGANFPDPEGGIDQLLYMENLLKTDPMSRRILWNLWNPSDIHKMALPPCHYAFQMYVEEIRGIKYLSGLVSLRSNDGAIGAPINYFSYYTLLRIFALRCGMRVKSLTLCIGDAHIYSNHIDQIKEQITRIPRASPVLEINSRVQNCDWGDIELSDFSLIGYFPHPTIKMQMAV